LAAAPPDPLATIRGPTSKGRGRKGRGGKGRREGRGEGRGKCRGNLLQGVKGIDAPENIHC